MRYTDLSIYAAFGGIAQLGERLHGMQEVSGSIPLISTILKVLIIKHILDYQDFYIFMISLLTKGHSVYILYIEYMNSMHG